MRKMEIVLNDLKPSGLSLRGSKGSNVGKFFRAVSFSLDRAMERVEELRKDSQPGTSEISLSRWAREYGVNSSGDSDETRGVCRSLHAATGGQSSEYIRNQISRYGIFVSFVETRTTVAVCGLSRIGEAQIAGAGYFFVIYYKATDSKDKETAKLVRFLADYYRPAHVEAAVKRDNS